MKSALFRLAAVAIAIGATSTAVLAEDLRFISHADSRGTVLPTRFISLNGDEDCGNADKSFESCECDTRCGGFEGGVELLFLNVWANHGAGERNGGNSWFNRDPETIGNMRYWLGYRNAEGLGVRARCFSYYSQIGAGNTNEYFDVSLTDVEATALLTLGKWDYDFFGGVRIGDLRWSDKNGNSGYNFTGAGLTLGGSVRRQLIGNLGLVSSVRTSFLLGQTKEVVGDDESSQTLASMTEVRLGMDWQREMARGNFVFGVAWEQQVYTGLSGNVDSDIDPEDVDLSLGGPVLWVGFQR